MSMAAFNREDSATEKLFELIRTDCVAETTQILLQESVDLDINARAPDGFTPLLLACSLRQESIVELLIECGANVDSKCDEKGWTALHYASDRCWINVVRTLVQKVSYVDSADGEGRTALHLACGSGSSYFMDLLGRLLKNVRPRSVPEPESLDVVKCLVEKGANIHLKCTSDGPTPLLCAAQQSKRDVVDFLLASGATCDEAKLLYFASSHGWADIVRALLKSTPDLSKHISDTEKALHEAARKGYLEIVKCLVEAGVDIHSRTVCGQTPLHSAAFSGHLELVKWFVEQPGKFDGKRCNDGTVAHKFDIDAMDHNGMTALVGACIGTNRSSRFFQVVQYLLQVGASWKIGYFLLDPYFPFSSPRRGTVLNIVTHRKPYPNFELIKIFIENGAYLNIFDYEILLQDSSLKVLQDVELCCQTIINQFNNHHLLELYNLPESESLPSIEHMKIGTGSEIAQSIMRGVEYEIQTNGHCNVLELRPMALSLISVRSLLKHHEKL